MATTTGEARAPKPSFPIYFTIVTDGQMPGRANLLQVTAYFQDTLQRTWNILPQSSVRATKGLTMEVLMGLAIGAIPIRQAMEELTIWLKRFEGQRIPITSGMDFWHLYYHMSALPGDLPFRAWPIDIKSFWAGSHGDLTKNRIGLQGRGDVVIAARLATITEAVAQSQTLKW